MDENSLVDASNWPVYENYRVEGHAWVTAEGGVVRQYDALVVRGTEGLVTQFARLRGAGEERFAAFAKRWGLLGVGGEAVQTMTVGGGSVTIYPPRGPRHYGRDSIEAIRAYAIEVGRVLDLHHAVRNRDWQGLRDGVRAVLRLGAEEELSDEPEVLLETARRVIADILNAHLEQIHHRMYEDFYLRPYCPALITALYWHLADILTRGLLLRCSECGELFFQTDARQRYCPPEEESAGRAQSPCALRARQRRYQDRIRQDPGGVKGGGAQRRKRSSPAAVEGADGSAQV
jgi:hypothetical protein